MKRFMKAIAAIMLMTAAVCTAGCTKEGNKDVKVTTNAPQNITQTSATISGEVEVVADGITITEKGVCWGTSKNPTVSDNHMASDGRGVTVSCTITGLEPGTTYHVRVYATDGSEYYYGTDQSFTTEGNLGGGDDHAWVDLGLPSGTLWATCNVGANSPEGYGDYFAWGETEPKAIYDWNTYKYCNGDYNQLTKYCSRSDYGYNDFTDNLTVLQPSDDVATVNWGEEWCIPTANQWLELLDNVPNTWITQNGVNGWLFSANNGNSLFLPAAGCHWNDELRDVGLYGGYWSSLLYTDWPAYAEYLHLIGSNNCYVDYGRCNGQSVRAVRSSRQK